MRFEYIFFSNRETDKKILLAVRKNQTHFHAASQIQIGYSFYKLRLTVFCFVLQPERN